MSETLIPIPGRLRSAALNGYVSGAVDIYDDVLNEDQQTINNRIAKLNSIKVNVFVEDTDGTTSLVDKSLRIVLDDETSHEDITSIWRGETLSFNNLDSTHDYKIILPNVAGWSRLSDITITPIQVLTGDTINITYHVIPDEEDDVISSYMIDQSGAETDPYNMVKSSMGLEYKGAMTMTDVNVIHRIWSNTKLYAADTQLKEDKLQIREISRSDKRKWADNSNIDESKNYDYFMKLPEFWWRCSERTKASNQWLISFSLSEQSGWNHWQGNTFIGVYKGYIDHELLYSRRGVTPIDYDTYDNYKTYAEYRGDNYSIIDYETHRIMCLLGWGWLGTLDDQKIIGYGCSTGPKLTGIRDGIGIFDTNANGSGDYYGGSEPANRENNISTNIWGLENFVGDLGEWLLNVSTFNSGGVIVIQDKETGLNRNVQGVVGTGTIMAMLFDENTDVIPIAYKDSAYDEYYACFGGITSTAGNRSFRSQSGATTHCGLGYISFLSQEDNIGSRLIYTGDYEEVDLD